MDLLEKQFDHPDSDTGQQVAAVVIERTRQQWVDFSQRYECCIEPVLDLDEVFDQPLFRERKTIVTELDQPEVGLIRQLASAIPTGRGATAKAAPRLGEHTDEVLAALGYSSHEVDAFKKSGVI